MPDVACKKCGAKASEGYSYCANCGNPLDVKGTATITPAKDSGKFCVNCGAPITPHLKYCSNCGRALSIDLTGVLNSTIRIIRKQPVILLPYLLETVINGLLLGPPLLQFESRIASLTTHTSLLASSYTIFEPLLVAFVVPGVTIFPLVNGMYPSMVKAVTLGEKVDFPSAFKKSVRKYPSILISTILVTFGVILAGIALVIPGIIVSTWYYYTTPAIVLQDRGAPDGMSASHAFARDKKWLTFGMLLVSVGPSLLGSRLLATVPITVWNGIPYLVISFFFGFLSSVLSIVIASYVYLTYAMPTGNRNR